MLTDSCLQSNSPHLRVLPTAPWAAEPRAVLSPRGWSAWLRAGGTLTASGGGPGRLRTPTPHGKLTSSGPHVRDPVAGGEAACAPGAGGGPGVPWCPACPSLDTTARARAEWMSEGPPGWRVLGSSCPCPSAAPRAEPRGQELGTCPWIPEVTPAGKHQSQASGCSPLLCCPCWKHPGQTQPLGGTTALGSKFRAGIRNQVAVGQTALLDQPISGQGVL